jgi:hypothetical protein
MPFLTTELRNTFSVAFNNVNLPVPNPEALVPDVSRYDGLFEPLFSISSN